MSIFSCYKYLVKGISFSCDELWQYGVPIDPTFDGLMALCQEYGIEGNEQNIDYKSRLCNRTICFHFYSRLILHSMCGGSVDYIITRIDREVVFDFAPRKPAMEQICRANVRRRYKDGRSWISA